MGWREAGPRPEPCPDRPYADGARRAYGAMVRTPRDRWGQCSRRTGRRPMAAGRQSLLKARTTSSRSTCCTSSAGRTKAVCVSAFWSCCTAWTVPISRPLRVGGPKRRTEAEAGGDDRVAGRELLGDRYLDATPAGRPAGPGLRPGRGSAGRAPRRSIGCRPRIGPGPYRASHADDAAGQRTRAVRREPTTGMPTLRPASLPASMPTSQERFDGIAGDDPDRQQAQVQRLGEPQQLPQLDVLRGGLRQLRHALLQAGELAAQLVVLRAQAIDLADRAEQRPPPPRRRRQPRRAPGSRARALDLLQGLAPGACARRAASASETT